MKTIYCLSRLPEWLEVAQNLRSALNWEPFYWLTVPGNYDMVGTRFPNVVRHLSGDANRGLAAPGCEHLAHYPLDAPLLRALADHEAIAFDLMDRMDLDGSFRHIERRRTYCRLMMYWLSLIESHKPDRVLFNAPPHSVAEYTLYAACCIRDVSTVIFFPTAVNGLHLVGRRLFEVPQRLIESYRKWLKTDSLSVTDEGLAHINRLRMTYEEAEPWYSRATRARDKKRESKKQKILKNGGSEKLDSRNEVADERLRSPICRVYKRRGMPLEAPLLTRGEYHKYLEQVYPFKARLEKIYNSLTEKTPLDKPFVYMPLHYQPERTTCPDGGRYNDQWLSIEMLSHALPKGAWLYVKEHPSQFSYHGNGEQARTLEFYRDVADLPNVKLVDLDVQSFDLIDRSLAVATVTGMAGWEAVVRCKPALVFGAAWYLACKGVFWIDSYDQCRKALDAIFIGAAPSESDILAYIAALEEVGISGYTNPSAAPAVEIGFHKNVAELTRGIVGLENAEAD